MDMTFEYSRPFRALKFWLAMRVHGAQAFRDAIERNLHEAQLLWEAIEARDDFEALGRAEAVDRPVPPRPRRASTTSTSTTSGSPTRSRPTGAFWIASALIDDEVWLRPCFVNFRTTEEDVLDLVEVAAEIGRRLAAAT